MLIKIEGQFEGVATGVEGLMELARVAIEGGCGALNELVKEIEDWIVVSAHEFREDFIQEGTRGCRKIFH